ncbi:hypothetical protein [Roseibium sediminicola]|uniref:Uncharacterized protein n=1 Tax=Roseibium sediminicola TaxID=2933272 RepID=A0ABT0GMF7_9HYPH|nr:hypothetical protein [Roseibium sp. CAU 1639]MCK7610606.1 hypothetical protein [Roseibium sp. CAU 1639]
MSYHDTPGLGGRLLRLPGQLLLALVNATALLVIAACVLALIVLGRVETAGDRIAGTVTDAALARLDVSPADFKTRLDALDGRLEALSAQLADPDLQDHWEVARQLKELNENLAAIKVAAAGLGKAGPDVTAAAFDQAGELLTDALYAARGCESVTAPEEPAS